MSGYTVPMTIHDFRLALWLVSNPVVRQASAVEAIKLATITPDHGPVILGWPLVDGARRMS